MVTLTRTQVLLATVPLVALLALAGSRIAATGTSQGPRRSAPLAVVDASPAAAPRVVVYVVGAVRRSGIYRLREGARVADALERAGGPAPKADLTAVNLAAPIVDGQQIVVPSRPPAGAPPTAAGAGGVPGAGAKVSLSSATVDQLDELPGVGPVTAQKIVDWRASHPLRSVDDLDAIPGIGPARIEQLRELVQP
jgi:competence protein ComEA